MKELLKRLTNKGTLISVVCTGGLLLNQFGIKVDMDWLNVTINLICMLGIALGVLNNTETKGLDNPFVKQVDTKDIKPSGEVTDFRG